MENKRIYKHVVFAILSVFTLYIVLDLFNIPQKFNIPISNINTDLFGIVSSAVVALVIYFISYNEIDDRKIKREDNAKDTAKVLLADTYKECLNTLELLGNREILEAFIVPKVDFNKTNKDDKIMNNLQTLQFESFYKIISLSEGGYISKDKLEMERVARIVTERYCRPVRTASSATRDGSTTIASRRNCSRRRSSSSGERVGRGGCWASRSAIRSLAV